MNRDILDVRGKPDQDTLQNTLTENTWNQLEGIRTLSNESFEKHSELYKCQAPKIQLVATPAKKRLIIWDFVLKFNYGKVTVNKRFQVLTSYSNSRALVEF